MTTHNKNDINFVKVVIFIVVFILAMTLTWADVEGAELLTHLF